MNLNCQNIICAEAGDAQTGPKVMPPTKYPGGSSHWKYCTNTGMTSVVDPKTLNLDPDPGVWPNLDPDSDPDPGLYSQFWNKKFQIIIEKNNFLWNKYIFVLL